MDDAPEKSKNLIDFIRWVNKWFRKALKHGTNLYTLFNLIEKYVDLRFIAYK